MKTLNAVEPVKKKINYGKSILSSVLPTVIKMIKKAKSVGITDLNKKSLMQIKAELAEHERKNHGKKES